MLDVTLPGTGGMLPLPDRWLSCCWLEYKGSATLIDCGEGTQIAIKKCGVKLSRLDRLLITHYHADHVAGLPGLLLSLGNSGKRNPLTIAGPPGLKQVVSALTLIAPMLPYRLLLLELPDDSGGEIVALEDMDISYLPLLHGIPCFGYRLTIKRKPVFNPRKAESLGIPIRCYKLLHSGKSVTLEDGRLIIPEMVLDGIRAPIRVTFCTDTQLTEAMIGFARGSDLLISEGMYPEEEMKEKMESRGHMLMGDSARLAAQAGVKKLWLTHYSPAIKTPSSLPEAVLQIFSNAVPAYDGISVTLGKSDKA